MRRLVLWALLLFGVPALATAGEIYGTIKEGGKAVRDGLKVTLTCGGKTVSGDTDKFGGYRLFAGDEGKCTLTLKIGDETPSVAVESFEDSARYNLILERKDGRYTLRSE